MKRIGMSAFSVVAVSMLSMALTIPAHADPLEPEEVQSVLCKDVPISSWGDPKEIIEQIKALGYDPFNIRIEKGCWEVKTYDPQNEVYEFYVHPVSKDIVLRKHKPKGLND